MKDYLLTYKIVCKLNLPLSGEMSQGATMRRSKEEAEQTRQKILIAAEQVFSAQGVQGSSLEQIAREAGVTRGAIYWHFKDKADVLQALRDKFRPPADELTEAALNGCMDDVFEVFERSAERFLELFAHDPSRQRIFLILSTQLPNGEGDLEAQELTRRLVDIAQMRGILHENIAPQEAALLLAVVMKGLLSEWLASGRAFDLQKMGMLILRRQLQALRKNA